MAQKSAYLDGFWQNERYFQPISTLLRDDFQLRDAPTGLNLTIADKIASTNSVSVHVRRGDYVSNPTVQILHGLLPISYYQRAIALIQNYTNEAHYFVFSDDPEWARAHLDIRGTTMFISHNNLLHDYEDLRLMSLCHHHIVANSTFSWWGAWLSNYPEKIVIAPRPWMNSPDFDTHDFFPANWMQMDLKEQPNSSS